MRANEIHESAVEELKNRLPKLKRHTYNTIDSLMQDISFRHKITGKKLHDLFVKKYGHTPDTWIKKIKNKLGEEDIQEGQVIQMRPRNPLNKNLIIQLKALSETALEIFWEGSYMPKAAQGQIAKLGKDEEQRMFKQNEAQFRALGYEYSMNEENSDLLYLHSIAREAWYDAEKPANMYRGLPDLVYNRETNKLSYYDLIGDDGYEYTDNTQFDENVAEGMDPDQQGRLNELIDDYNLSMKERSYWEADSILDKITREFGKDIADQVDQQGVAEGLTESQIMLNEAVLREAFLDSITKYLGNKTQEAVTNVNNFASSMQVLYQVISDPAKLDTVTFLLKKRLKLIIKSMPPAAAKLKQYLLAVFPEGRTLKDFFKALLLVALGRAGTAIAMQLKDMGQETALNPILIAIQQIPSIVLEILTQGIGVIANALQTLHIGNALWFEVLNQINQKIKSINIKPTMQPPTQPVSLAKVAETYEQMIEEAANRAQQAAIAISMKKAGKKPKKMKEDPDNPSAKVFQSMGSQLIAIGKDADKIKKHDSDKIKTAIVKKLEEINDPKLTSATRTFLQKVVHFNRNNPKTMAAIFGFTFAVIARVSMQVSHNLGLTPTQATLILEATLPTLGNFLGYIVNGFSVKDSVQAGLIAGTIGVGGTIAASGALTEFANDGNGDDGDGNDREYEILHRLASQWWNGTEQQMIKAQRTLEAMGWEIGEDEGYDDGGVFVVRAGDVNGKSYISWPHEDLTLDESITEDVQGNNDVQKINDFIEWSKKTLNIKRDPKFTFSKDTEQAKEGHHTGVHSGDSIWIYIGNRNLIDIFRTIFHELVHQRQEELNMIKKGDSYPGSPIEALADMMAGKYIKIYGKDHPEIFQ